MSRIIEELESGLGSSKVSIDGEVIDRYTAKWWPYMLLLKRIGAETPRAQAIVFPESSEDVSYIVKAANRYRACLIPFGGGSSVTGAILPRGNCIIVSLERMNRVLEINDEDLYVLVESGIVIADLERRLSEKGYSLRYFPQSYHLATVGGSISSMGTGSHSTGYGGIEDLVLNLEVVSPLGDVFWVREALAPRSSMGPDLKRLYIGAEGRFGIVTKAVLKIFHTPPYSMSGGFEVRDLETGVEAVRKLISKGITPALARVSDPVESRLRFGSDGSIILLSFEGYDKDIVELLWRKAKNSIEGEGGKFLGDEPYRRWIESRYRYEEEIRMLDESNMWFETFDISATWSRISTAYRSVMKGLEDLGGDIVVAFAHASHFYHNGAALYFTVVFKKDPDIYWRIVETVMDKALESGASLSHHHGVGVMRSRWLDRDPGGTPRKILDMIKKALDPNNIINPYAWSGFESSKNS